MQHTGFAQLPPVYPVGGGVHHHHHRVSYRSATSNNTTPTSHLPPAVTIPSHHRAPGGAVQSRSTPRNGSKSPPGRRQGGGTNSSPGGGGSRHGAAVSPPRHRSLPSPRHHHHSATGGSGSSNNNTTNTSGGSSTNGSGSAGGSMAMASAAPAQAMSFTVPNLYSSYPRGGLPPPALAAAGGLGTAEPDSNAFITVTVNSKHRPEYRHLIMMCAKTYFPTDDTRPLHDTATTVILSKTAFVVTAHSTAFLKAKTQQQQTQQHHHHHSKQAMKASDMWVQVLQSQANYFTRRSGGGGGGGGSFTTTAPASSVPAPTSLSHDSPPTVRPSPKSRKSKSKRGGGGGSSNNSLDGNGSDASTSSSVCKPLWTACMAVPGACVPHINAIVSSETCANIRKRTAIMVGAGHDLGAFSVNDVDVMIAVVSEDSASAGNAIRLIQNACLCSYEMDAAHLKQHHHRERLGGYRDMDTTASGALVVGRLGLVNHDDDDDDDDGRVQRQGEGEQQVAKLHGFLPHLPTFPRPRGAVVAMTANEPLPEVSASFLQGLDTVFTSQALHKASADGNGKHPSGSSSTTGTVSHSPYKVASKNVKDDRIEHEQVRLQQLFVNKGTECIRMTDIRVLYMNTYACEFIPACLGCRNLSTALKLMTIFSFQNIGSETYAFLEWYLLGPPKRPHVLIHHAIHLRSYDEAEVNDVVECFEVDMTNSLTQRLEPLDIPFKPREVTVGVDDGQQQQSPLPLHTREEVTDTATVGTHSSVSEITPRLEHSEGDARSEASDITTITTLSTASSCPSIDIATPGIDARIMEEAKFRLMYDFSSRLSSAAREDGGGGGGGFSGPEPVAVVLERHVNKDRDFEFKRRIAFIDTLGLATSFRSQVTDRFLERVMSAPDELLPKDGSETEGLRELRLTAGLVDEVATKVLNHYYDDVLGTHSLRNNDESDFIALDATVDSSTHSNDTGNTDASQSLFSSFGSGYHGIAGELQRAQSDPDIKVVKLGGGGNNNSNASAGAMQQSARYRRCTRGSLTGYFIDYGASFDPAKGQFLASLEGRNLGPIGPTITDSGSRGRALSAPSM